MEFVRTIDAKFAKYDAEGASFSSGLSCVLILGNAHVAAWPSAIDDFVEYAKGRVAGA